MLNIHECCYRKRNDGWFDANKTSKSEQKLAPGLITNKYVGG